MAGQSTPEPPRSQRQRAEDILGRPGLLQAEDLAQAQVHALLAIEERLGQLEELFRMTQGTPSWGPGGF
jgi:hypothetical protein